MSKFTIALIACAALFQGCASSSPEPGNTVLRPSPEFAPVYPQSNDPNMPATGGIYASRQSDAFFGRSRNYRVGDIITVILNEQTQSARTQNSDISRESRSSLPSGMNTWAGNIIPQLDGINLNQNTNASKGTGKADQTASLVGSIAVTVVDVLANGNLVVKGEKKLGLSEGTEVIQVTGIIRPEDVGPNSTVQSRRLANAQIAYRGAGDLANAARVGWGTSLMHRFWPF
jgi:flagellar L-ring protein precursor FlgH